MENKIITLEELAKKQYPILLDTNVFIFRDREDTSTMENLLASTKKRSDLLLSFQGCIKESNFYTLPSVLEELEKSCNYGYRKTVRRMRRNYKGNLEVCRGIKNKCIEQRRLISLFEEQQRILKLEGADKTLYESLYKKYERIKRMHNLKETGFELLISWITMAEIMDCVGLASESRKFTAGWDILAGEDVCPEKAKLFTREENYHFREISRKFNIYSKI